MALKEHEKFVAFVLLGCALMTLAILLYIRPLSDTTANGGVLQILNSIIGAMTLAFGGATQALFKISDSDRKAIGEATATAMHNSDKPIKTIVENDETKPVPTTEEKPAGDDVPPMFKE
jgi:hypothetical protein